MLLALFLSLSMAVATVTGTVKDATGGAVPGASVVVMTPQGVEQRTVTGPDGRFTIERQTTDRATLVVKAGGFAEQAQTLDASTTNLDITLAPAGIFESVNVTPTRSEQRMGDVPASVAVLDSNEIRQTAAVVADDVLRQLPTFSLFRRTSSIVAHPTAQGGVTIVPAGEEAAALAPLPLALFSRIEAAVLAVPGRDADAARQASAAALTHLLTVLEQWGLRTWGAFAALPSAEIASRFKAQGPRWQAIARGVDPRPLVPLRADEQFTATMPLEWPIEGLEPLSFVLTRLLEPLSTRLERADRGAAALHTTLRLITRDVHERTVSLPAPLRDVRTLRTLVLLDLEAHPPSTAIDQVTMFIEPTPARVLQHTLFTRAQPTPETLSTLIARMTALMGQDRVGAPVAVDSHRPGAFAMQPFAIERPAPSRVNASPRPPQPFDSALTQGANAQGRLVGALRRCRRPVPVRVTVDSDGRPQRMTTERRGYVTGAVASCFGPWQTSGEWWAFDVTHGKPFDSAPLDFKPFDSPQDPKGKQGTQGEDGWDREEWDVVMADGTVYRLFCDCVRGGWFLDGTVD